MAAGRRLRRGDGRRRLVRPARPAARCSTRSVDGSADLAVGRRRPVGAGVWPWHARAGNALVVAWLRRRIGLPGPRHRPDAGLPPRADLLALGRPGPPVRLPRRAAAAGHRRRAGGSSSTTSPTTRGPPAPGPRSPARCAARCGPPATSRRCSRDRRGSYLTSSGRGADETSGTRSHTAPASTLVVSPRRRWRDGPRPGWGDTGRGRGRAGRRGAARHPRRVRGRGRGGALPPRPRRRPRRGGRAVASSRIGSPAGRSRRSVGSGLGERLAHAVDAGCRGRWSRSAWTRPQLTAGRCCARSRRGSPTHDAVLGPAIDGGWWVLALRDPRRCGGARPRCRCRRRRRTTPPASALRARRPRRRGRPGPARRRHSPTTRRSSPPRHPTPGSPGLEGGAERDGRETRCRRRSALRGKPCVSADDRARRAGHPVASGARRRRPRAARPLRRAHARHRLRTGPDDGGARAGAVTCRSASTSCRRRSRLTQDRGAAALCRDVFDPLPARDAGPRALLADGNVGIGGDPVALLRRIRAAARSRRPGGRRRRGTRACRASTCALRLDCGRRAAASRSRGRWSAPTTSAADRRRGRAAVEALSTGSAAAGAPCSRRRDDAPLPTRRDFTSAPAQPGRHGPGRALARDLLRDLLPHRPDQPLRPERRSTDPVPDRAGLGLPGHAGPARHHRHRRSPVAAGQAVVGLPEALPAPAARRTTPRADRPRAGLDRGAGGIRDLPARDRAGQLGPVVPLGVLVPPHPLRRRLGRDRRPPGARRGEAAVVRARLAPTSTTTTDAGRTARQR